MNKTSNENKVNEKEKVMFPEIVVRGTKDKPYYEIKYYDMTDKQWHLGYGSYNLEYVMQWKEECLEVVEGSITNDLCEKIKERLKSKHIPYLGLDNSVPYGTEMVKLFDTIEIVNQVAEEYRTTMGQVKCDTSFSDGYIKAIDDAIEKFLEYGCFLVEWNPKLSKENLVTDVLRQVKGQAVYNLEKMKQKEIDSVNQVAREVVVAENTTTNDDWISLPKVAFNRMIARMESESERDIYDEESLFINVRDVARIVHEIAEEYKDSEMLNLAQMNADFQNAKLEELKKLSEKLTSSDDGWIPCGERLPEDHGEDWVQVQIQEKDTGFLWIPRTAEYRCGKWWLTDSDEPLENIFEVIAWRKLPEQYKPKGEK